MNRILTENFPIKYCSGQKNIALGKKCLLETGGEVNNMWFHTRISEYDLTGVPATWQDHYNTYPLHQAYFA